jgi:uncharacterized membrane protein
MAKNVYTPYDEILKSRINSPARKAIGYFLQGLLVVIPIGATIGILVWMYRGIQSWLDLGHVSWGAFGIYILIGFGVIVLIGVFTKGVIAQQVMVFFEGIIDKAPGLNLIFGTTKDLTHAFVGEKKKFNKPVVVEISSGLYRMGFMTQTSLSSIDMPEFVSVYLPYSYAFSGEMIIVHKDKIRRLDLEGSDVTKFVLSGGAAELK